MLYITSSFLKDYSCDGFAFEVINLLKNKQIPFNISLNSFIEDHSFNNLNSFSHASRRPNDFQIVINPACFLQHYPIDNKTIVYTMWDSSILPIEYVNTLLKCRLIIVPSEETKKVFIESGVNRPIIVIPHGFDNSIFYPIGYYSRTRIPPYTFGASGQIMSPVNDKKDLNKVIKCFQEAFVNYEDVALQLKVTDNSIFPPKHSDPRIKIIKECFSNGDMCKWYHGLDCYVNLSKYEAFGRQPMEVIACGIPIITPIHSGIADYYHDHMGFTVGHEKINANCHPYIEGSWYEANEDEVVSQMRYVFKNKTEAYNTGLTSASKIRQFNNANWHDKFLNLIKRYCY